MVLLVLPAPPVLLLLSYLALQELIELPARLRELPGIAVEHAADLSSMANDLRRPTLGAFFGALYRPGSLLPSVVSVQELLTIAPLLRVASPPFILLTIGAGFLSLAEILLAVPVALWFLISRTTGG